jgi:transcriptional regulator with XRE-family HTH domain
MYKRDRVYAVLQELIELDKNLIIGLRADDLLQDPRLSGIGQRTLQNTLKSFRFKNKITPQNRQTKNKIVSAILKTMATHMPAQEFKKLSYKNLSSLKELKGIGKTTISVALAQYKKLISGDPTELKEPDFDPQDRISVFSIDSKKGINRIYKIVAENTKQIRAVFNMSRSEFSDALNISSNRLARIERGEILPSGIELSKLHFVLGIDINFYLFNQGALFKSVQFSRKSEHQILLTTIESLNQHIKSLRNEISHMKDKTRDDAK